MNHPHTPVSLEPGQRVAARPWLWLPAPGAAAVNTLAPYYCPATIESTLVDLVEVAFDRPQFEVWPQRQMVAPVDLHPWPHHCRECRATAAPLDPASDIAALRRRCAALEAERDALRAELFATRATLSVPA
ncbi:hypothetical protein L0U85_03370 [Glycomyces sp. L485]|uniref:hypothetical protein n=1 Tax=Glycomyces sp. L485 TaxID=2909235 RepID=UPI001F4B96A5|nr:hypothetical protein [Glycomyces sp. L485]MCH7229902.1 hypothetical protein [Glycomyces sp. L485]